MGATATAPAAEGKGARIFVVKTSIGHERIVADSIAARAKRRKEAVYSILCPTPLRGYVLIETNDGERLQELVRGIPKVRGVIKERMSEGAGRRSSVEVFRTTSLEDRCRRCSVELLPNSLECTSCGADVRVESGNREAGIGHFLTPKPPVAGIKEADIVEIVAGPFKGEKARVKYIDQLKEEITVELLDAPISIPITVRGDHIRLVEKEEGR